MRAAVPLLLLALAAGCTPNPRNEIAAIASVALHRVATDAGGGSLCVNRTIGVWEPAATARRIDPPTPSGFGALVSDRAFRGGGGLKGREVGGVAVRDGAGCFDLRGPVVAGDRAMLEVHLAPVGRNVWLRKTDGGWRAVATTTSVYPG